MARRYVRWYYDHCDRVTSPSRDLIAEMRRDGLRAPASVVANPLAFDGPRGTPDLFEPKRWPSLPGFALLHVGSLAAGTRVDEIIHALPSLLTRIPRVTLALIGRGAAEASLRKLAETLQVSTHVRFLGHVTPARLRDAYAGSDVFVTMDMPDTRNLALIEAMAFGLPVIVARSFNLTEHVDTSRGLLVDPGSPAALAEAIVALHRHPGHAAALGAAGRAYAAHFSPDRIAAEWEQLYGQVLSPARRTATVALAMPPDTTSRR
jgi:glycosyltransferase involved in cell wall biosynthesis